MNIKLEVIGFTIDGCRIAQAAGAHRIELCDNPKDGGTTPSYGFIKLARKLLQIELYPIIRPRGGDFLYNEAEFSIMVEDVKMAKQIGCEGIATGILTRDGHVDKIRMQQLCALAYPLEVTFHRAFDRTADPYQALEDIIESGCERILTSGQMPYAADGIELIKLLVEKSDDRIIIMPGSGVNSSNIDDLFKTGATEFHTSARIKINSNMEYHNFIMNDIADTITVDSEEVKRILGKLKINANS